MHAILQLMKRFFLFIFIIGLTKSHAQIHEVGVFLGGSNYIGDVGKTNYVDPNEFAYGFLYKWNKSPRHSWRFSYMQSRVTANDLDSKVPGRYKRGFNFVNNLKEFSAGLEFNFFDFNLHQFGTKVTPYVFTGLCYTNYEELFVLNGESRAKKNNSVFSIPMILGIKANVTKEWILGFEAGARYTGTDNLDGSYPKDQSLQSLKIGNNNSRYW